MTKYMDDNKYPVHSFEIFPRDYLNQSISRQEFFKVISVEFKLLARKSEGANAININELGIMDDEFLFELVPGILPDCQITINGNDIYGQASNHDHPCFLFSIDDLTSHVFNLINGRNDLRRIVLDVEENFPLTFERAFLFTRGLFLTLVKAGVCLPKNNPRLG